MLADSGSIADADVMSKTAIMISMCLESAIMTGHIAAHHLKVLRSEATPFLFFLVLFFFLLFLSLVGLRDAGSG